MSAEERTPDELEWQVAMGSRAAHLIDPARPEPRRSGPRAKCGRYPQRHEFPWFSYPIGPGADQGLRTYSVKKCPDCADIEGAL